MADEDKKKGRVYGERTTLPVGLVRFEHVHQFDEKFKSWNIAMFYKPHPKIDALRESCLALAAKAFPGIDAKRVQLPFFTGGADDGERCEGLVGVKASTRLKAPELFDYVPGQPTGTKPPPLPSGKFIYPGCLARINVTPCTYIRTVDKFDDNGVKVGQIDVFGVKFYLNGVQWYRDGERIAGGASVASSFSDDVDESDVADSFADTEDSSDGLI